MSTSESESAPMPATADALKAHESRLRALGMPLMIAPAARLRDAIPRSSGLTSGLAVACAAAAAFDRANDHAIDIFDRIDPSDEPSAPDLLDAVEPVIELLVIAAVLLIAAPLVGWIIGRTVRNASRATGYAIGLAAVVAVVVVPVFAFSSQDGPGLRTTSLIAALALLGSYVGLGSLLRWSARRVGRELGTMGPMVARVLPILMLAVLFLFFSAEIWQVMIELSWPRTFALLGVMAALTVLLVGITTRDDIHTELAGWSTATPLRRAERANIVLVPVLATLIQAALFATLVFAFFMFLGWIAVPEATEAKWTGSSGEAPGGLLFGVPFSVTLVRVALILAMFSALNLAASAASDPAHHRRFVRPMIDEVMRGLTAREEYLAARRS